MSFADLRGPIGKSAKWLPTGVRRYTFAVCVIATAILIRYILDFASEVLPPFVIFFPAIIVVSFLAGFGPGVFATILATTSLATFPGAYLRMLGSSHGREVVALCIFFAIGAAISGAAAGYRRHDARLREFERLVEGLDDMIVVVGRDYRYLIANQAFLNYRGMTKEQVIGRHPADVLNPGVFESTVKEKLDECFQGKVVQFEMRYQYPSLGARELLVSYFPLAGARGIDRVASVMQDITDLRQADRSLQLFRALIDQSNDAVEVVDPETLRLIDVNEKACQDLGYGRSELLAMTVRDFDPNVGGTDRPNVVERLRQGECVLQESVHRRKDGSTFPVEISLKWVNLDRAYLIAVSRDISKRRKTEEALRASESHFRILVEQASDGIFVADQQGRLVDVNTAGAEMLGYTREEILRLNIADLVAPEDVRRIATDLARATAGGSERSEWTLRRKDGSLFPGEVSGKQLPDGRLQGILRDITERKLAEQAMRRNEERFRVALKDSPITVFNQDLDLRYTWIYNPQLYWQNDVIGKTDEDVLGSKGAAGLNSLKRNVLKTGSPLREEVAVTNNGKRFAFDVAIEPLFGANGRVVGITGTCMDIARLRAMADELRDAKDKLAQEKSYLESEIQTELGFEQIIGQSPALREVLRKARVVAPTNSTVLLLGETGTGKELVARSVHSLSSRRDKTFVKLNCAAVPSGLLESELFGHEKGAFTGAVSQKIGRIELADEGTLFLDEIGELPPELQPKLLRVLQDREFERLGSVRTLHVDVRIIAATNRDLHQDMANKKFREDLFYRLNVFPIELPPLRARRDDIAVLVRHFVGKHAARAGKHIEVIPEETIKVLQAWSWPGNIRELENMIERMVILSKGNELAQPPAELTELEELEEDNLTAMERDHIIRILRDTNGVLSGTDGAASRLGVKRTTLQSMLKRFGIEPAEYRRGNGTFGRG